MANGEHGRRIGTTLSGLVDAVLRAETVRVHVIPFTATGCGAFGASMFHLIDFTSPRLPILAW